MGLVVSGFWVASATATAFNKGEGPTTIEPRTEQEVGVVGLKSILSFSFNPFSLGFWAEGAIVDVIVGVEWWSLEFEDFCGFFLRRSTNLVGVEWLYSRSDSSSDSLRLRASFDPEIGVLYRLLEVLTPEGIGFGKSSLFCFCSSFDFWIYYFFELLLGLLFLAAEEFRDLAALEDLKLALMTVSPMGDLVVRVFTWIIGFLGGIVCIIWFPADDWLSSAMEPLARPISLN